MRQRVPAAADIVQGGGHQHRDEGIEKQEEEDHEDLATMVGGNETRVGECPGGNPDSYFVK